ncbi:type VII secretion protein EccB [Streptomyces sp. TM32]|uniref:type VII secretion protein EccB n=1 Tax=Streptomyces sp. TM32 TaxID=1652669 RepID=UPI0010125506|nr:type VII secretion protein EccB [Streptomyces sp. TM32]RXS78850.1 type VII secretion protein EccB [Streptomyces sp. TM32]
MASRRDELNAYSFARKRTNAAFLKPLPNGSIESAPKPLKAVVPSIVMGVVVLVGFGACGILKPVAPQGWDTVGANVVVGSDSTTRYVVLPNTDASGKSHKLLHPVLNLASARLLLDPNKFQVVQVKDSELDGKLPHGPAVGIPYAPDRLPGTDEVDKPKVWAVCDRPGSGENSKPQQTVFVLGGKDKDLVEGKGKLDNDQALYIEDPKGLRWLVDEKGVAFQFDATLGGKIAPAQGPEKANSDLQRIIFGDSAEPQKVSQQFMDTLIKSPVPIAMPRISGAGKRTTAMGVPDSVRTIGTVLQARDSQQKYVVQADGVYKVSDFVANLLLEGQNAKDVHPDGTAMKPAEVSTTSMTLKQDAEGHAETYLGKIQGTDIDMPWPTETVSAANNFKQGSQTGGLISPTDNGVSCSVYKGTSTKYPGEANKKLGFPNGVPNMQTWVGKDYPAKIAPGASSYVTPGNGLLYRQASTPSAKFGSLFLVTDTGLRYSVPENNDGEKAGKANQEGGQSQLRLGYKDAHPPLILKTWSELLSAGPSLDVQSAHKPQAS